MHALCDATEGGLLVAVGHAPSEGGAYPYEKAGYAPHVRYPRLLASAPVVPVIRTELA